MIEPSPERARQAFACTEHTLLIGVRHHSPACAAALPALLDDFAPQRVLIELPAELERWLPWLGHPELVAPVALAGVREHGDDLAFYPFADFSPELAAVRWGVAHEVAVEAIDLPIAARGVREQGDHPDDAPRPLERLLAHTQAPDSESLWDWMVESRAPGCEPEQVRIAALLIGWLMRLDAATGPGISRVDAAREAYMRDRIDRARKLADRVAVVIGSFHAAALLDPPQLAGDPGEPAEPGGDVITSLIPYSNELLDSRSGYPAGIRDPAWQQRVFEALAAERSIHPIVASCIVSVCAEVRSLGHVAGVPDSSEAVRMAGDLSRLRGLPAPGRREVLESLQSALGRGELLGRGRVLARALDAVMVGRARGKLAPGTPRSGLFPHVESLLAELRLPGPGESSSEATSMRLDSIRSRLDRRRQVALERLSCCGIPYATAADGDAVGGAETLTCTWTIRWRPATEAMIELAGLRGVTLRQAAAGAVRAEERRLEEADALTPGARLRLAEVAAEAGLPALARDYLVVLSGPFLDQASLPEILGALALIERIGAGHVPGLPLLASDAVPGEIEAFAIPDDVDSGALLAAAVRALEGLSGSTDLGDAVAMLELVQLFLRAPDLAGHARLRWAIDQIASDGSPLMQGAAGALSAVLRGNSQGFGFVMGSWVDAATDREGARALAARLRGALTAAGPLFEADPSFCRGLLERVDALDSDGFLTRLPALRDGFEVLSTAGRARLLDVIAERLGEASLDLDVDDDPDTLARFARADRAGREAMGRLLGGFDD